MDKRVDGRHRIISMAVVFVLLFSMFVGFAPIKAAGAQPRITGITGGQLKSYDEYQDLNNYYTTGSIGFKITPDMFSWDSTPPSSVTSSMLTSANISLGWSGIVGEELISAVTSPRTGLLMFRLIDLPGKETKAFEYEVVLKQGDIVVENTRTTVKGIALGRDVILLGPNDDSCYLNSGFVVYSYTDLPRLTIDTPSGLTLKTNTSALQYYSVESQRTKPSEDPVAKNYPQISDVISLSVSSNIVNPSITFYDNYGDEIENFYVYDKNLNYLGRMHDNLPYRDKYYIAKYKIGEAQPIQYTVTYHPNGATSGSVPVDARRYYSTELYEVYPPEDDFGKVGEYFVGWNTKADGTGIEHSIYSYSANYISDFLIKSNIDLYAQWSTDNPYAIRGINQQPMYTQPFTMPDGFLEAGTEIILPAIDPNVFVWHNGVAKPLTENLLKVNSITLVLRKLANDPNIDKVKLVQIGDNVHPIIYLAYPPKDSAAQYELTLAYRGTKATGTTITFDTKVKGTGICKVLFDDGTSVVEKQIAVDTAFGTNWPAPPVKYGYVFKGWISFDSDKETEISPETIITAHTYLEAKWEAVDTGGSGGGSSGNGVSRNYSGYNSTNSGSSAQATTTTDGVVITAKDALSRTQAAVATAKTQNAPNVVVKVQNAQSIDKTAAQEMVKASGGKPLSLECDSILSNKAVDVRITLDPAKISGTINLSGSTASDKASLIKNRFKKWYKNNIQVISFAQQGSFGQAVAVAAKLDTNLISKTNLSFYSYDGATNKFQQILKSNYTIDTNGYVHFSTALAGDIVISEGVLEKAS